MRVIDHHRTEQGYRLDLTEHDMPEISGHEVRIKVAYAGVNRADIFQAEGKYHAPEGASTRLGLEVSGVIEAIGDKVKSHQVGEEVCALLQGGGYAEQVAVPEWRVLSAPKGFDLKQAAALPEALFTAYFNLCEKARLSPRDVVLIHGGAGGVGHVAVQLVRALGCRVYATAGSAEKVAFCEALGAHAIHYKQEDFAQIILEESGGVDVILDMVGAAYAEKHLRLLKQGGRLVSIAMLSGSKAEIPLAQIMLKELIWTGSTLRSQREDVIYDLAESIRSSIWPMVEDGRITPYVAAVFSPEKAMEAHEMMRDFQHQGKLLIDFT